jgi:hypothetical protein
MALTRCGAGRRQLEMLGRVPKRSVAAIKSPKVNSGCMECYYVSTDVDCP